MFLETHFGSNNITPITRPPLPPNTTNNITSGEAEEEEEEVEEEEDEAAAAELLRLQKQGIPLPGLMVSLDEKHTATIWLEDLRIECNNRTFRDRVQAVVERAVETVAPLWVAR